MPNSYYENDNPPENITKANAQNESADRDALEAAFDLLPEPSALNSGELNYQGTDSGAANTYAVAVSKITALANGQRVTFIPANTNTGASTLNVSALGASAILGLDGAALEAGEIVASRPVTVLRFGTNWFLQNSALSLKTQRDAAAASATAASASAVEAAASADSAALAANVSQWVSGTTYSVGANVFSPINLQTYRRAVAGAGTTDPSLDPTNWIVISNLPQFKVATARSSNTALAEADRGQLIPMTGTYTQTFGPVADKGLAWFVRLENAGSGDITLNFNGAEECDGLTSFIMYPGELRVVFVNQAHTGFESIVLNGFEKTFDSSGTFTTPPGYKKTFDGLAWSGGAGGERNGAASDGGCGGGCFPFSLPVASFGATETITIASGGAGRTTDGISNAGGNTTIGSLLTVYGGTSNSGGAVGTGQAFTAGSYDVYGGAWKGSTSGTPGFYGGSSSAGDSSSASANSTFGGAAGGSHNGTLHAAGTSLYGGNGGAAGDATDGADGQQPGGGGGATRSGTTSGAGGDGKVIIRGAP